MVRERIMNKGHLGALAEFGCGTGFYTQALVTMADRVTATDIVPGILAVAKKRINTSNVTFQLEDCQATSFPDEAFDTAFIVKPPRAFGKHTMTEKQLCDLLVKSSFSPRTSQ
jgi:ABC-2 type transport system ATP-binding protein